MDVHFYKYHHQIHKNCHNIFDFVILGLLIISISNFAITLEANSKINLN